MVELYALKEPTGDLEWDYFLLWEAARLKKFYVGTFYVPKLHRLLAVFKPTPGAYISNLAFEKIDSSLLRDAYRMICIPGCGKCCEADSGAFILGNELRDIPKKPREKLPSFSIVIYGRSIRVYKLDIGPRGRCIFYDEVSGGCRLEGFRGTIKPIICLIHYCTVFAEKKDTKYVKVAVKRIDNKYIPIYKPVDDEEWKNILRNLEKWKLRRIKGYSFRAFRAKKQHY